ncbi:eukaryotic phosphomannomutase [Suillus bovinus]|uniref:eukaryotic phosphomannomutase n=1 Tax=Suillus bovinus TaxID=48563 RepID=UPI001B86B958|nr:eukaryotic phosphomannomutase [Suillus bovinus]KAG2148199.1 eukaryotic phosphomannomutase [Suillus bovinus]
MVSVDFAERPVKKLVLFDVDGTLSPARQRTSPEIIQLLRDLRKQVAIGFVGGSDLVKISEQLSIGDINILDEFDFGFAENGLTAYRLGKQLESQSFIKTVGEKDYQELVNFILHYIADVNIPIKRGTFVEFRNGMINVSPIGRNASVQERHDFEAYDKVHHVRADFISFDVFPHGWDKTYCLRHVEKDNFEEIHFFGDKTSKGGNDYEIFSDPRTVGHTVKSPADTMRICKELFLS